MSEINALIIYLGCFIIGFIVGSIVYYKKYGRLVLEVLDNLKFTEKISNEQYEYYQEKFIKKKDSLKSIRDFAKQFKIKKEKEEEEEI